MGLAFPHALLAAKFPGMQRFLSGSYLRGSAQKWATTVATQELAETIIREKKEMMQIFVSVCQHSSHTLLENIAPRISHLFGHGWGLAHLIRIPVFHLVVWFNLRLKWSQLTYREPHTLTHIEPGLENSKYHAGLCVLAVIGAWGRKSIENRLNVGVW